MQTFFQNFMTQGDYETFYPYLMGVGKGAPNNFESSFDVNQKENNKENKDVNLYITIGVIVFVLLIGGYLLYKFSKR
jgi:hypothetical protein